METQFKLDVTTDYSIFKQARNRSINPRRVKKRLKSIVENRLQIPIVVNRHYQVVDGQHRLEALKQLGMPVPYLISYNWREPENTAVINNSQDSWNTENWLEFRASQGRTYAKDIISYYESLSDYQKKKITITTIVEILSDKVGTQATASLRNDTYKLEVELGNAVIDILNIIDEYPSSMKSSYNQKLARAVKIMCMNRSYINKKAIRRLCESVYKWPKYNNETDIYAWLDDLYKKHSQGKNS